MRKYNSVTYEVGKAKAEQASGMFGLTAGQRAASCPSRVAKPLAKPLTGGWRSATYARSQQSAPCFSRSICSSDFILIYIGLAMAWGFSISRRILHRNQRRWLLLGCAMAVLWLFLRAVKYRFFTEAAITRHLWYCYYVPQILAPLFSLFAALQIGRREDDSFSSKMVSAVYPRGAFDFRHTDQRSAPDGVSRRPPMQQRWKRITPTAGFIFSPWRGSSRC